MKPSNKLLLSFVVAWFWLHTSFAQTWIATNSHGSRKAQERQYWDQGGVKWIRTNSLSQQPSSADYIRETELTPSVRDNVPNARAYYNNSVRLFLLQKHEGLAIQAHASATYGGRIVADYDIRVMSMTHTNGLSAKQLYLASITNEMRLTAKYFRGRMYYASAAGSNQDKWITAFSSEDKTRLVFAYDDGPIFFSEDSGISWKTIDSPGQYEFILATTPKGSAIMTRISIATNLTTTDLQIAQKMLHEDWYSTVSAADGSKMVLAGGPSLSAPVLSISTSPVGVVITWPSSFINYTLQQNNDLATTNWVAVTNSVNTVDGQYQVIIPAPAGNCFYRLRLP